MNDKIASTLLTSPDFLQHEFNIYFVVCGDGNNSKGIDATSVFNSLGKPVETINALATNAGLMQPDFKAFAARVGTVEIPQMKKETFNMKVLSSSIDKVKSNMKFEHKSTFNIRSDENLIYYQVFNTLSNNQENTNIFFEENFSPFSSLRVIKEDLVSKHFRFDIIVKNTNLCQTSEDFTKVFDENSSSKKNFLSGLSNEMLSYWVFEDVNILGTNTDLEFNNTSNDPIGLSYPFIFKRVYQIDGRNRLTTRDSTRLNAVSVQ